MEKETVKKDYEPFHFSFVTNVENKLESKIEEKSYGPENLSDLTLIVGNYHFKVHKVILAIQSDVFSSIFTKEEKTLNLTERTNHFPKSFDRFLKEIYSGNILSDNDCIEDILFLVDFYNVKTLIEKWDLYILGLFKFIQSDDQKGSNSQQKNSFIYLNLLQICKRYKLNKSLNHGINIFGRMKNVIKRNLGVDWEKAMKNLDKDLLFMFIDGEMK